MKKRYPHEFLDVATLYNAGDSVVKKRFSDSGMRYLFLSDFYDYVKITHLYQKGLTKRTQTKVSKKWADNEQKRDK